MQAPTVGGVRLPKGKGETVRLPRGASLTDFADKIGANPASLVQVLFHLGEMVTATQSVSDDVLQLLGTEMNYDVQVVSPEEEDRELLESFDIAFGENAGDEGDLQVRPPVVTVMGHVDHGKTRLLDTIRQTNVRESEAGGITQHIGAYQVATELEGNERLITFIDTPGHEAFTAMRARGAKSTDIAVIVVAADDGVMPQTVEAINHAQAADVPIVVAVNKIDKEGANPAKIRQQLTEYGLVAEEYGGDTMFVDISAKQGTNIDQLLEAILLTADAALDLRANPDMEAQGVAIEAHLDRGRGPVATVLVQRGTLHVGDSVVAGDASGRVRRMLDEHGGDVEEALPSRPVQVIGFTSVPGAGDTFLVVDEDRVARQIADRRRARERNAELASRRKRVSLEDLDAALKETSQLNLIIKGDNSGTVEALEDALMKIEVGDDVELRVIHRGVGAITEGDINLAIADNTIVLGFNVRAEGKATELANREGVEIRYYSVIYQAIDEIEQALRGMLKPEFEEVSLGRAEVREVFRSSRFGVIAGCMVLSGEIRRNAKARLLRDNVVVAENLTISSLRRFKDDVDRGPRGLRVRVDPEQLQRPQARGPDRDLRAAGEAPQLVRVRGKCRACRSAGAGRPARGRPLPEAEAVGGASGAGRAATTVRGGGRRGRAPRPAPPGAARGQLCGCGRRARALATGELRAPGGRPTGARTAVRPAAADRATRRRLARPAPAGRPAPTCRGFSQRQVRHRWVGSHDKWAPQPRKCSPGRGKVSDSGGSTTGPATGQADRPDRRLRAGARGQGSAVVHGDGDRRQGDRGPARGDRVLHGAR